VSNDLAVKEEGRTVSEARLGDWKVSSMDEGSLPQQAPQ